MKYMNRHRPMMHKATLFIALLLVSLNVAAQRGSRSNDSAKPLQVIISEKSDSTKATTKRGTIHFTSFASYPKNASSGPNPMILDDAAFRLISYSFKNAKFYRQWKKEMLKAVDLFKCPYVLIVVSKDESIQRSKFVMSFYETLITVREIPEAYRLTVEKFQRNGAKLDFRHRLIINKPE